MGDVTVDSSGKVEGRLTITFTGQQALSWRQAVLRNDEAEVKKDFDRNLINELPEGTEAHVDHFLGADSPDSNFMAIGNVSGVIGTATAKRLLLPGFLFESRGHEPFVKEEKRLEPVDMHYGERIIEQITYQLPEGMTVEGAPADTSETWSSFARYIVRTKVAPGQIIVLRQLERAITEAKPDEYQDLRGFYQKVATGDQQQLVLHAATLEKGN